jgi:hydroxyacylglutathione hydrolase
MRCATATGARVFGPAREAHPRAARRAWREGDRIDVLGLRFDVFDVPGHTAGHIAYLLRRRRRRPAGVLRRHAVLRRLRPPVRGHAGADADSLDKLAALPRTTPACAAPTNTPSET